MSNRPKKKYETTSTYDPFLKRIYSYVKIGKLVDNNDTMKEYLESAVLAIKDGDEEGLKNALEEYHRKTMAALYKENPEWGPLPEEYKEKK